MSERTPFAGLEVLAPGDPLSADNYRFQWTNPSLIDHFLKIGASLHTHDELPGLVNPTTHPELAVAEGGGIPAGQKLYACFTKVDALGGETLASAVHSIETPGAAGPPASAPTAAVDHLAGALLSNTYTYALTVQDGKGGETVLGPATTIFVVPGFAKAEIKLKGLKAIWEAVTTALGSGWRLWRSTNGGPYDLLATGNTDEVVDDGTKEVNCNVEPPEVSTMNGTYKLTVTVPVPSESPKAEFFRLYLSETEAFTSPCFVAQYPVSEYGTAIVLTELNLLPGAPPLISTSIAHAKKIDPDTSLIEFHWKRPKTKPSELPTEGNEVGDIRITTEERAIHMWTGTEWRTLEAARSPWQAPVKKASELPTEENAAGDVRLIEELGELVTWDATAKAWVYLARWRAPVAKASELPTEGNTNGDVRLVLESYTVWTWNSTSKTWSQAAGGGHTIENGAGVAMTGRTNVEFLDSAVSDDEEHNRTVVAKRAVGAAQVKEAGGKLEPGVPGEVFKLTPATVDWDVSGIWDAEHHRFVPTKKGIYLVSIAFQGLEGVAKEGWTDIVACKNGLELANIYSRQQSVNNSVGPEGGASGMVKMNGTTDYLEMFGGAHTGLETHIKGDIYFAIAFLGSE